MIQVFGNGKVYAVTCSYDERSLPKQAGFLWHGGNCKPGCKACESNLGKVWWTFRHESAALLKAYANPAALAMLEEHSKRVDSSRAADANIEIPLPPGLELFPFQRAGVAYMAVRDSVLLGDEMGLGKSPQSLALMNLKQPENTLIICPASLRLNWKREAEKWLVREHRIRIATKVEDIWVDDAIDSAGAMAEVMEERPDVVIVSDGGMVTNTELWKHLMTRKWQMLIMDEAHRLKNPEAARTKRILGITARKATKSGKPAREFEPGLIHQADRKLALTGTPILNKVIESHTLLAALDPVEWGNFFGFAKRYCDAKQVPAGRGTTVWDFGGSSHEAELQERLRSTLMVRRLKRDVLTELPPKLRQVIVLEPDKKAQKALSAEAEAVLKIQDNIAVAKANVDLAHAAGDKKSYEAAVEKLKEAHRVAFTGISEARHATVMAKIPLVIEHLQEMFEGGVGKAILFAHHKDAIAAVMAEFGDSAVKLTGDDSMEDRQAAVDQFQTDPACKLFVGSITAAGVGITLTAASHVRFAELTWVPAEISQAEDRAHRIGQKDSVNVGHLVFDNSLDARIAHMLVEKQRIADAVLDDPTQTEPIVPLIEKQEPRPRKYPAATDAKRVAAREAMVFLAERCDGAKMLDGAGFSRFDTVVGTSLAKVVTAFTDGQVWLATRLARVHKRQLPNELRAALEVA